MDVLFALLSDAEEGLVVGTALVYNSLMGSSLRL